MAEQRHGPPQEPGLGPLVGASPTPNEARQSGGTPVMRPSYQVGSSIVQPLAVDDGQTAEERDKARARTRGVPEDEIEELPSRTMWFVSNRTDDRTVLFERDPRHPGGETFIGGSAPARAYRTPNIERLLMSGEIIEVPEPRRTLVVYDPETDSQIEIPHPKRPIDIGLDPGLLRLDSPGQPTRLGRRLDPDLWEENELRDVARRQNAMPREIRPMGSFVPRSSDIDRSA